MKRGNLKNIGKIIKLSGKNGELIFSSQSISIQSNFSVVPVFIELQNQFVPFYIDDINPIGKDRFVVKFNFVNSIPKASLLLDKAVFLEEKNAAANSIETEPDLNGYLVIDENYGEVGRISSVDLNKKNPLLIIDHKRGEVLLPFNEEFILGIDTKNRILNIIAPPGLIELYTSNDEEE